MPDQMGPSGAYPLARHILDALRENPEYFLSVSVAARNHPYIHYRDDRWEFVRHMTYDWYVAGYVTAELVASLVEANPINFKHVDDAYALSGGTSYWDIAERDDLFCEGVPFAESEILNREDELAPWDGDE